MIRLWKFVLGNGKGRCSGGWLYIVFLSVRLERKSKGYGEIPKIRGTQNCSMFALSLSRDEQLGYYKSPSSPFRKELSVCLWRSTHLSATFRQCKCSVMSRSEKVKVNTVRQACLCDPVWSEQVLLLFGSGWFGGSPDGGCLLRRENLDLGFGKVKHLSDRVVFYFSVEKALVYFNRNILDCLKS